VGIYYTLAMMGAQTLGRCANFLVVDMLTILFPPQDVVDLPPVALVNNWCMLFAVQI
jgi:hypothetical protein